MQKLEKLFESLDEKVFTAELKENLEAQFNVAVDEKSEELAESKSAAHIELLNEKSEEHIELLNEKSEEHIELLNEKSEEHIEAEKSAMVESLNKYLTKVVEEFVADSRESLAESIKSAQSDLIVEAFESVLLTAGVSVSDIIESKDNSSVDAELTEAKKKYDELVDSNIELKEENEKLLQLGVITEMGSDLSIVEAEKFKKLADLVEFDKSTEYSKKLQTIKESVLSSNEQTAIKKIDESKEEKETPSWAHLV